MDSLYLKTSSESSIHASIHHPPTVTRRPLVVFIHYWGGSSSTWHKLTSPDVPASLGADYPTLVVDLRGWGKSTGPSQDDGTSYSISAMASDIASVLDQLESDTSRRQLFENGFILVGHSMGAKVSLAALSYLSASLRERVRGLVLIAPAPPTALDLSPEMKAQQAAAYETEQSVVWTVENVLANASNLEERDVRLVVHDSLSGNALAKKAWPTYGMAEDISHSLQETLRSKMGPGLRVAIVVGELDVVEPKERVDVEVRQFLQDLGLDVSWIVVPGVRHLIPLERPAVISQIIRNY